MYGKLIINFKIKIYIYNNNNKMYVHVEWMPRMERND